MRRFLRRLVYLFRQRQISVDLAEELDLHRQMMAADLEASGMNAQEANSASRRMLGNVAVAREDARAVWVWRWLDDLYRDIVYAVRTLGRAPAFTLACVVSLALGVGVNAAMFAVFHAMMLKALPVAAP